MSVACDRSLMLVVEEGRSGRGESARSNSNIFYSVGELSEEGVAHRYVPFASTRVCVVRRGKCQGQGGNRSGCDCLSVHKFGGSGEWDVGLWAGLESGLACRRQSPLLRTRQVRGFYIVERAAAWLASFSVRPGSFQLARVEATWLGVCCAVLVRHLVSNGHVTRGVWTVERMELSSLTECSPHPFITRTWWVVFLDENLSPPGFPLPSRCCRWEDARTGCPRTRRVHR